MALLQRIPLGLVELGVTDAVPAHSADEGDLAIDRTNGKLYARTGGVWVDQSTGGGGGGGPHALVGADHTAAGLTVDHVLKALSATTFGFAVNTPAWTDVTGKPATFPPDAHNHDDRYYTESEIITLLGGYALDADLDAHTGAAAPHTGHALTAHVHPASDITSGLLALTRGGTGADGTGLPANQVLASPNGAPGSAGYRLLAAADMPVHNHEAANITSGTLPVARGGTGLGALGTPLHHLRVNAGGTALEYAAEAGGGGGGGPAVDRSPAAGLTIEPNYSISAAGYFRVPSGQRLWVKAGGTLAVA